MCEIVTTAHHTTFLAHHKETPYPFSIPTVPCLPPALAALTHCLPLWISLFWTFYINRVTPREVTCDWFRRRLLKFIQVVARITAAFPF